MSAIVFALAAYAGWGTGDIFGAIASRKMGGYSSTFWSFLFRAILFVPYLPLTLNGRHHVTLGSLFLSAFLALILILGTIAFLEAFRNGSASLVGTIGAAFVVPTVILSVLFLNESLTTPEVFAVLTIVVGLTLTTLDFRELARGELFSDKSVPLALLAMLSWGIYFSLVKIPVKEVGWFLPNYIAYLLAPVVLLVMKLRNIPLNSPDKHGSVLSLITFTLVGSVGNFSYNIGISKGYSSIVAPIAGAYPTLFVVLSYFIFGDKLNKQQLLGIVVSLAGIVALGLTSV
ncbi:MAG: DMT family transporter [Dehalococcoidia bacterium]